MTAAVYAVEAVSRMHATDLCGRWVLFVLLQTVVGGNFYNSITNPGLLPESANTADSPLLVSSCDIVEAMADRHPPPGTGHEPNGTSGGEWDHALWESLEPFCNPEWADSDAARREPGGGASGSAAMSMATLRSSVLSWADEAFVEAHTRLYDDDGWLPRGFVRIISTFYWVTAGPSGVPFVKNNM